MGIRIEIKNQKIKAEVNGMVGTGCVEVVEKLRQAMDATLESQELKEEYHQGEQFLTNENGG